MNVQLGFDRVSRISSPAEFLHTRADESILTVEQDPEFLRHCSRNQVSVIFFGIHRVQNFCMPAELSKYNTWLFLTTKEGAAFLLPYQSVFASAIVCSLADSSKS